MKLSKRSLLILSIGIFIIALVGLWMVQSQQVTEQNELKKKLNTAELKLNGIQPERLSHRLEELEQQLDQALSQSEEARSTLSQPVDSITINDILFIIAQANSVKVTKVSSAGFSNEELQGITFSVLPLEVIVEGDVANIASFITKLNEDIETGVIKSVEIDIPEEINGAAQAGLQIVIYTYRGN